ncbi:MAG TPA: cysteine peptidase family C39 domain-containing protein [Allosphingosinicella sp.]|nr:cysteine peptidase family C39 domain-containing protein [Allosphingosinicella sp.]
MALAVAALRPDMALARVEIERQSRDDDCGPAALALLMRAAGIEVRERDLLRLTGRRSREPGMSAGDLVRMVAASGTQVELRADWIPVENLAAVINREPSIVLLYEARDQRGTQAQVLGHFVVLEAWSERRGFLVADPAIGRRAFMQHSQVAETAHVRERTGRREVLLLRLWRNGNPAVASESVSPGEEADLRDLLELRQLPYGVPAGRTMLTLSVTNFRSTNPLAADDPLALGIATNGVTLSAEHGIGNGASVAVTIGGTATSTRLYFPGSGSFSIGRSEGFGAVHVGVTSPVEIGLPANTSTLVSLGTSFRSLSIPAGINAGIVTQFQHGKTTFIATANMSLSRVGADWWIDLSPSVAVARSFGRRWTAGLAILGHVPIQSRRPEGEIAIFADFVLSSNWAMGVYVSRGIFERTDTHSQAFGFSITYAIPRRIH